MLLSDTQHVRTTTSDVPTRIASSTSETTLFSSGSVAGRTIYNASTQVLYVKLGTGASTTSFSTIISAGGYYEVPFGYSGAVTGVWASANGYAHVTTLT